jgi:hypothetical protein
MLLSYVTIIIVGPFHKLRHLVAFFPLRRLGFDPRSVPIGFIVEKLAMGRAFSKYYGFPYQFSFTLIILSSTVSSLDTESVVK